MKIVTLADAKTAGLKRYFTGEPCPRGHLAERSVVQRMCLECIRIKGEKDRTERADYYAGYRSKHRDQHLEYCSRYYAENKEDQRERAKVYRRKNADEVKARDAIRRASEVDVRRARERQRRINHPELMKERQREHYLKHREKIKRQVAAYRAKYPDKARASVRASFHKVRAHRKAAPGRFSRDDIRTLHVTQNFTCAACPTDVRDKYHIDHITPLKRGGSNWPSNLQLLCQPCNLSKGTKTMDEWAAWKAELRAYSEAADGLALRRAGASASSGAAMRTK